VAKQLIASASLLGRVSDHHERRRIAVIVRACGMPAGSAGATAWKTASADFIP
jgi:hypothetical protein